MGEMLFEDAAREFLAHHRIYSEDPETLRYQFVVLERHFAGRQRYAHLSGDALRNGVRFIGPPRANRPPADSETP